MLWLVCVISVNAQQISKKMVHKFDRSARQELIDKWYPLALDRDYGGYYSDITYNFNIGKHHDKMIVTQSRQVWVNSKAYADHGKEKYLNYAEHGFQFLKTKMWDKEFGGFYNLVSREGNPIPQPNEAKTAYGNAFAIYALAAYYEASGNIEALQLAQKTFQWLEKHSHDPKYKGYFQHMEREGMPIERSEKNPSTSDVGYKDQNSSIHLLEAFTELYKVSPNPLLKERLTELFLLIRDTIINKDHYMNLFFEPDWTPVSFKKNSREYIAQHYYLDHVSFGHDVETAYLLLEASKVLKRDDLEKTWTTGKKMVDHSLRNGWDIEKGGFYDGGYYFESSDSLEVVNLDKNWWAQAEGLNTLLLMAQKYPDDPMNYYGYFEKLWDYTNKYIMDDRYGGWYEWGLDTRPETKDDLKGHIWKTTYHNFRALINCRDQLKNFE